MTTAVPRPATQALSHVATCLLTGLLATALAGCSVTHSGPAHQARQVVPTKQFSASSDARRPASTAPPPLSPVAMVGARVYDDRGAHDSGVRDVATYVNTHGGLVIVDRHGSVWLTDPQDDHARPRRIGSYHRALTLVTDADLHEVGWLTDLDGPRVVLNVVGTRTTRPIGTVPLPPGSRLVSIDGTAAYVVDRTPRLRRIDLTSGLVSTIPTRHPLDVEDVVDGHLVVFEPGGGYLVPVEFPDSSPSLQQPRHRLPLINVVSPGLRYGAYLEGDAVRELATGRRVAIHVPAGDGEKVTFYGWLGPTAVAFEKADAQTGQLKLYSCDLAVASCRLAVTVPNHHLVEPGGWSPPAA